VTIKAKSKVRKYLHLFTSLIKKKLLTKIFFGIVAFKGCQYR